MIRLFILLTLVSLGSQELSAQRISYKDKLDQGSKMIKKGGNFTYEKTKDKTYKYKLYYPETRVITKEMTSKKRNFQVLDGYYVERYDDGQVVIEGNYKDNKKEGVWKDRYGQTGSYNSGERQGKWKVIRNDRVSEEIMYLDGQRHGESLRFDTLGNVENTDVYKFDVLISTTRDTSSVEEIMPRFPGCEDLDLSQEEKQICSQKLMLKYIYGSLKYPRKARRQGIEGRALLQFMIDKDGSVIDIKILNGLTKEIEEMILPIIEEMPTWIPAERSGKKVKVKYTLPVKFQLEG